MPRDFVSNFVLKIAGILDVFQDFYKQKLEQKIGHFAKREFLEVPYCLRVKSRKAVVIPSGAKSRDLRISLTFAVKSMPRSLDFALRASLEMTAFSVALNNRAPLKTLFWRSARSFA